MNEQHIPGYPGSGKPKKKKQVNFLRLKVPQTYNSIFYENFETEVFKKDLAFPTFAIITYSSHFTNW